MTSTAAKKGPAQPQPSEALEVGADSLLDYDAIAHYGPSAGRPAEGAGLWSQLMGQWLDSQPPAAEDAPALTVEDMDSVGGAEIAITGQSGDGGEPG